MRRITRTQHAVRPHGDARRRLCGAMLVAGAFVAACASPTPPVATAPSTTPDFWSGRFAVTWSANRYQQGEEHASGRFELLARDRRSVLDLTSPLGQTIARVTIDPHETALVLDDGSRHSAASADALTEQVFGWRIPLADLPRWLSGRIAQPERFDGDRPTAGIDNGWFVRFDAFTDSGPRRLALQWPAQPENATQAAQRIELRLVVDRAAWLGPDGGR